MKLTIQYLTKLNNYVPATTKAVSPVDLYEVGESSPSLNEVHFVIILFICFDLLPANANSLFFESAPSLLLVVVVFYKGEGSGH